MQDLRAGSIAAMLLMATLGGVVALAVARAVLDTPASATWLLWLAGTAGGLWCDTRRAANSTA